MDKNLRENSMLCAVTQDITFDGDVEGINCWRESIILKTQTKQE